ncbi:50S ribosomal protein L4 [Candidatus Amesbacteria bacterium RIFCSPHIGHO2_02_FULL_47_9]|uniref:Large ribosomal subunit protein uL4 n=2 Tax=Microgenomates group TaxID=1794810 RepID=A0A0H4TUG7_9BACT|nr:50S ribosomal protein L4, large subunit ribosomal protein L4 [uncultured Microgenomates bacterium Rifle_16ft_4_minimus_5815]OGC93024.1 MAG: 50S ribosomal protein L4 [Candidatus Amesbacteria bacterium RIFCSPHIGHO2_01_FULL_48_32b]OGD05203.1 MAG: 50S ribosomal protein L4 [Candidatus Amesbacteria bacterium RIFCSPHIGHO2_02_FULL_47_9]OGD07491.1 MAG: 50S ribosomal protein L4 [Candidatus Amesbacteria bacterium RIFCSPLOWO2_01_FULL_49_25]
MTTAQSYNLKGERQEKLNLPKEQFGVNASPSLLAQAVRIFLSNQRRAAAKTKTRAEVAKTTAKMYKQKGTGRARHGSYAAPIFVGGGVAHGPSGEQNYRMELPKHLKRKALAGALTEKAKAGELTILTGGEKAQGKSKEAQKWIEAAGLSGKRLIVTVSSDQEKITRGFRNLEKTRVVNINNLNPYVVMTHQHMVITLEALKALK